MDDLLRQGITAYKAGKREEARRIFIAVVKQDPENEPGWGWMYQTSGNDRERIYCLQQMLRINPQNEKPGQLLNQLLAPPPPAPTAPPVLNNSAKPAAETCPRCRETLQPGSPRCTYCGWDINGEKPVQKKKNSKNKTGLILTVAVLIGAVLICGLIYGLVSVPGTKFEPVATPTRTPEENAWYACTVFIENQLKVSILDAQRYEASGVILLDNAQYRVDVTYAKLATTYTCILADHSGGNWELMSLGAARK